MSSVLAWDQCCPEMQSRSFNSRISSSQSPGWVLFEDLADHNIGESSTLRPLEARDYCWEAVPHNLREAVFATAGPVAPEGWQAIGREVRAADGELLHRGMGHHPPRASRDQVVETTLWVIPARLGTTWCTLGQRGHVESLDGDGNQSSRGPIWIIFTKGLNPLLPENAAEVTPEEPLRGDEAMIKKNLLELAVNSQSSTKGVDYMEILTQSPLLDHLRQCGLKVEGSEVAAECLSAAGRAAIRLGRERAQPKVLFARWSLPDQSRSEARRAAEDQVTHRFVCELAREQRRDGLHFLVDYEVEAETTTGKEILTFAEEVLQYEQDGVLRVRAGSFVCSGENISDEGHMDRVKEKNLAKELLAQTSRSAEDSSDECLGDRVKEENLAKELLEVSDFSFAACQVLLRKTSLPGGAPVRSGTRGASTASSICTFGLFSHGGVWGITRQSKLRPHFTNYINKFLDWHGAANPRTSFSVNTGVGLGLHVDKYNLRGTMNSVISFGPHDGGHLWVEDACQAMGGKPGERSDRVLGDGRRLGGQRFDPFHKMVTFDAHFYHEVEPWRGQRYSVACWTNHSVVKMDGRAKRRLRTLGFRPDAPRRLLRRPVTLFDQHSVCEAVKALCRGETLCASVWESFPSGVEPEAAGENEPEDELPLSVPPIDEPDASGHLRVTASQKRLVHKVHVNVGHPPKARFLRMMRAAGALPHVLQYIKDDYECDQCSIRQRPDNRHRARCPRSFEFNRVLSIDIFYVKFGLYQVPILNMTDTGTCYQVLQRLPIPTGSHGGTPTSEATWRAFLATWVRFFGPPEVLVCDAGSEFKAAFERGCEGQGILQHVVLPENPWKNAMSERHGGFVKHRLDQELSSGQCVLQNWEDLDDYLHEMISVKNRWLSRGGVSPTQLVFGRLPRVPGDLLSDDHTGLMALHDALEDPFGTDQASTEFRRRMGIRERARQATMTQASREAVQRAVKASTHQTRRFHPGQWVYCFRRGRPGDPLHPRDRWVGPGLVVVANNSTVYVGMRTRLWRCSPEQLRLAHPAEEMGQQLASDPGLSELLRRVLSGSTAGAVNVMREGPPSEANRLAPVDQEESGPPLAAEAPTSQAEEVLPIPPGLLPPGLPPPANEVQGDDPGTLPEEGQPAVPSRRSSTSEPAGEPPSQQTDPLPGIPEDEPADDLREGEPVRKAPRVKESEGSRAPGTPMQPLLQAVRNAVPGAANASSSASSLTPSEEIPSRGRVDRQVREWEEVTATRKRERTPPPRGHAEENAEELLQLFASEGWSGSFSNFQLGDQTMTWEAGEWTWLAKRNDEVSLKSLAKAERDMFEGSDLLEWKSIIDSGAVKVLTGQQAKEARARYPTRILSSRMVRRKKPVPGLGKWKPKSRWCIHGHHDPDTGSLVTYAPTPASESLQLFLQASINLKHVRAFADVKSAFTQSLPLKRPAGPIFAEPCDGLQLPADAIIQILIPVYGLDDAPAAWRETVAQYLVQEAGFVRNLVEPCWFSKFEAASKKCIAQILVEVDDFIVSASSSEMPNLRGNLQSRFRFGKWEEGNAEYAGRYIEDNGDHLAVSQEKYIIEQVSAVPLVKERKRQQSERLTPSEFEAFRSLVYKLNWLGRETRPEAAGVASIMASRLQVATVKDIMVVNRFVNHLRNTAKRPLKIWQFDPEAMVFLAISAGGVNTKEELHDDEGLPTDATQGAWLALTAEALPEGDRRVRASPISWRSSKLKRKVFSTFGGETQAMLQGVNEVEWLQVMYRDAVFNDVQLRNWQASLSPHMLIMRGEKLGGNRNPQCVVTDAKSLYDCILKEHPAGRQDRKSALELAIILRDLQSSRSMVRWIPHQKMLADGLTKEDPFRGNGALEHFLRTGVLSFVDMDAELESTCERAINSAGVRWLLICAAVVFMGTVLLPKPLPEAKSDLPHERPSGVPLHHSDEAGKSSHRVAVPSKPEESELKSAQKELKGELTKLDNLEEEQRKTQRVENLARLSQKENEDEARSQKK
ncbi:hypothetical protein AK812_SmicGene12846 [Symbiodinium microadriaticum]|uniref:Copia protein n=1 Tax=Symbiodinium microadriaticum TaxID=2951 RepID=A0A1Q9E9M4_SYMMI|nr:hypothetical protein AK812_SmicGene12846 [Symbiodinium microadriaticum]